MEEADILKPYAIPIVVFFSNDNLNPSYPMFILVYSLCVLAFIPEVLSEKR